ncbi:MAG: hypothetical protein M9894_18610 [Planctomycetes bacterium]|nr:hypothetical protein [Planctomycetota bacterium]
MRDVIPAAQFKEVARLGGLLGYLEPRHGPGRYQVLWVARDLHTIDSEIVEVPDLMALRQEKLESERRQRADELEAKRQRELDAAIRSWAREWVVALAARMASLGGTEARRVLDEAEDWLIEHADTFVRPVRIPDASGAGTVVGLAARCPSAHILSALSAFVLPREASRT